jgi:hypothetical protein
MRWPSVGAVLIARRAAEIVVVDAEREQIAGGISGDDTYISCEADADKLRQRQGEDG